MISCLFDLYVHKAFVSCEIIGIRFSAFKQWFAAVEEGEVAEWIEH